MLTAKRLREALRYDPHTGQFTWLETNSNRAVAGTVAGTRKVVSPSLSYVQIRLDGVCYRAHRLAWFYVHGVWPDDVIDHKNGLGTDNRWSNIRAATKSQNQSNRRTARNNTSGRTGVWFRKDRGTWVAELWIGNWKHHIGTFGSREEAVAARAAAERNEHGDFARAA